MKVERDHIHNVRTICKMIESVLIAASGKRDFCCYGNPAFSVAFSDIAVQCKLRYLFKASFHHCLDFFRMNNPRRSVAWVATEQYMGYRGIFLLQLHIMSCVEYILLALDFVGTT